MRVVVELIQLYTGTAMIKNEFKHGTRKRGTHGFRTRKSLANKLTSPRDIIRVKSCDRADACFFFRGNDTHARGKYARGDLLALFPGSDNADLEYKRARAACLPQRSLRIPYPRDDG